MIRDVKVSDAKNIIKIYNYYIENTTVTFEESPLKIKEMEERIKNVIDDYPWIVYEKNGVIQGYAYGSRWRERAAYKYSVESTVYVDVDNQNSGIGTKLYIELIERLRKINTHLVIAGVSLPNRPSQKLHEKLGFNKCAHFNQVGFKNGSWLDVGYWELILNENL